MQLSMSSLNIYAKCKKCFYLDKKLKVPQPRGIFSGMPIAVDSILKDRFNDFRGMLPHVLDVEELKDWHLFPDKVLLKSYRQWNAKDALKYKDQKGNILVGALDDVLVSDAGLYVALDYKTTGSEPEKTSSETYYTRQMDIYSFLLSTKYKVADFGVLLYFWPVVSEEGFVKFESKPMILEANAGRGLKLFEDALELLDSTEIPEASSDCEFCKYHRERSLAEKK